MVRRRIYGSDDAPKYDDPAAVTLAKNLNALMLKRGWRQRDVVANGKPFAPPGHRWERYLISSWMTGKHMPDRINMDILAKTFGVSVSDLVPVELTSHVVGKPDTQPMQITIGEAGRARVKLDLDLPAATALEIMTIAQKAISAEKEASKERK